MDCDLSMSIPDWIIDHPETATVFNELGLDVSCGGKSLEYVVTQKGLQPDRVLAALCRKIETRNDDQLSGCEK